MKKIYYLFIAIFVAYLATSCSVTMPLTATNNPIGDKRGTATNTCLFGAYATGMLQTSVGNTKLTSAGLCFNTDRYSIFDAAEDGGISKVATVDLKTKNFILWQEFTLIVTGE